MTKEVLVTIEGMQLGEGNEPIIMIADGTYHFTKGRHYIQYDEKSEENIFCSKNMIKISASQVLLTKKANQTSQMEFDLNEITQAAYQTPYGEFLFDVRTESILLSEEPGKIKVIMKYSLSTNESHVSDNSLVITVIPV